jgi:hypothetical protein
VQRADDAHGDLAAVRYQDARKHAESLRIGPLGDCLATLRRPPADTQPL